MNICPICDQPLQEVVDGIRRTGTCYGYKPFVHTFQMSKLMFHTFGNPIFKFLNMNCTIIYDDEYIVVYYDGDSPTSISIKDDENTIRTNQIGEIDFKNLPRLIEIIKANVAFC